jgi:hypothetical protein
MARLARIEVRELERAESDGCYLPIRDAREYTLLAGAARRESFKTSKTRRFIRHSALLATCATRMALPTQSALRFSLP